MRLICFCLSGEVEREAVPVDDAPDAVVVSLTSRALFQRRIYGPAMGRAFEQRREELFGWPLFLLCVGLDSEGQCLGP